MLFYVIDQFYEIVVISTRNHTPQVRAKPQVGLGLELNKNDSHVKTCRRRTDQGISIK